MILGVLADTHGQHRRTANALRLLKAVGAEAFVHCGDICGDRVIDQFAGLRAWLIPGNCDQIERASVLYAATIGVKLEVEKPLVLDLAGRRVAVFHGHEAAYARLLESADGQPRFDYVLHGHTHDARDERVGRYRVINPGALHRAAVYTVATIDLESDAVAHWIVTDATKAEPERFLLL
jgi:hypothetical protein